MGVPVNPLPPTFTFAVKQEVPNDEDVEWLYPSCLFYVKKFFRAFRSTAN